MEAASSKASRIGWKATAGSVDKNELISEFQSALLDEINSLKKGDSGKKFEIYNGTHVQFGSGLSVYRFPRNLIDEPTTWLRDRTPLTITIDDETIAGILVSSDPEGINIGLEVDKGDVVEEASVQNTAFRLLEDLVSKLERIRSGEIQFNFDGSMKLFGFHQPNKLSKAISSEGYEHNDHVPNTEQKMGILTALSQEVTYIWGPPGTGKTKTLATILNLLIKARQSVLLVANTHVAVDEILKNFVGNKENASIIEAGKIIRLGVSTVQDESFDGLLIEKIVEKQIAEITRRTEELQAQIDSNQETTNKYEQAVKRALSAKASMETQIYEHNRLENEIQSLQDRMANVSADIDRNGVLLASRHQLLEKARTANRLRRMLLGLSIEQIDAEIKFIENIQEISKLKLQ
ncbi:AAA family ATPase, partial [Candidatus Bathyarchaeota archaeon]|nr:AAA family ATPase [Candidatus Bathyarchaeota archaeon]